MCRADTKLNQQHWWCPSFSSQAILNVMDGEDAPPAAPANVHVPRFATDAQIDAAQAEVVRIRAEQAAAEVAAEVVAVAAEAGVEMDAVADGEDGDVAEEEQDELAVEAAHELELVDAVTRRITLLWQALDAGRFRTARVHEPVGAEAGPPAADARDARYANRSVAHVAMTLLPSPATAEVLKKLPQQRRSLLVAVTLGRLRDAARDSVMQAVTECEEAHVVEFVVPPRAQRISHESVGAAAAAPGSALQADVARPRAIMMSLAKMMQGISVLTSVSWLAADLLASDDLMETYDNFEEILAPRHGLHVLPQPMSSAQHRILHKDLMEGAEFGWLSLPDLRRALLAYARALVALCSPSPRWPLGVWVGATIRLQRSAIMLGVDPMFQTLDVPDTKDATSTLLRAEQQRAFAVPGVQERETYDDSYFWRVFLARVFRPGIPLVGGQDWLHHVCTERDMDDDAPRCREWLGAHFWSALSSVPGGGAILQPLRFSVALQTAYAAGVLMLRAETHEAQRTAARAVVFSGSATIAGPAAGVPSRAVGEAAAAASNAALAVPRGGEEHADRRAALDAMWELGTPGTAVRSLSPRVRGTLAARVRWAVFMGTEAALRARTMESCVRSPDIMFILTRRVQQMWGALLQAGGGNILTEALAETDETDDATAVTDDTERNLNGEVMETNGTYALGVQWVHSTGREPFTSPNRADITLSMKNFWWMQLDAAQESLARWSLDALAVAAMTRTQRLPPFAVARIARFLGAPDAARVAEELSPAPRTTEQRGRLPRAEAQSLLELALLMRGGRVSTSTKQALAALRRELEHIPLPVSASTGAAGAAAGAATGASSSFDDDAILLRRRRRAPEDSLETVAPSAREGQAVHARSWTAARLAGAANADVAESEADVARDAANVAALASLDDGDEAEGTEVDALIRSARTAVADMRLGYRLAAVHDFVFPDSAFE